MTARLLALAACAVLLSGCTSLAASDIAAQALQRCPSTSLIQLDGGRVWDSASVRIECGAPAGATSGNTRLRGLVLPR